MSVISNRSAEVEPDMFGLVEVRLMLYSMKKTAENLEARLKILGPESEDRIGIGNDLMLCHVVIDKLSLLEEEQLGQLSD